ncbi:GNAT family N-acetyltransferase [Thalassococcus sp. CAU 1522]|uniref:GNAT family N-acetyltransferase n=1 Tax=Thalassococcus arenae TaxID=2851652 RepID=A0ABS6N4N0_9RHOB|nr:GNAT family N-acetyltransferase [Thalassococcus arenae]MBV2358969.1 GNAT family N-acetyltransferase [Thalassococcus arenae]
MTDAPDLNRLFAASDATWPAAARIDAGPWRLREGRGGGKRVSAATAEGPWRDDDLPAAEDAMRLMGQPPLFMLRQGEDALDAALDARGYRIIDPVRIWLCPIDHLADRKIPRVTAFAIWEPLAAMREIWAQGGIGEGRIAVMERAPDPKTGLFGRAADHPAGAGFCAVHDGIAMVHALEIAAPFRGKGLGGWMMRLAAHWGRAQGATHMAVLCTKANAAANGLYASLGLADVGEYHYRILDDESDDT